MSRKIAAEAHLEYGGRWWHVLGEVWLGTTGPGGPDPTEVDWRCFGDSNDALIEAIYADTELCRSECEELVMVALCDRAREVKLGNR